MCIVAASVIYPGAAVRTAQAHAQAAFGNFTGTAKINIDKTDAVFAIADNKVVRVN